MIEDIKLTGLSDEIIDKIYDELGYDIVLSMAFSYKTIKNNVELLETAGINNIEELLINKNNIFFMDTEKLKQKLMKKNISSLVDDINENYEMIEELLA